MSLHNPPKTSLPNATIRILDHLNNTLNLPRSKSRPKEDWVDIARSLPEDNVIRRLVYDNPAEKAALADLYLKYLVNGPDPQDLWTFSPRVSGSQSIFFESGSTLVYVADALKEYWTKANQEPTSTPFAASTNNNLVALLNIRGTDRRAAGNVGRASRWPPVPWLFPGYLEPKYHGLFPFHVDHDDARLKEEQLGYSDCRLHLSQCKLLLLAASRLSLIHGPLVGSRENAIFKNACYNSCVPSVGNPSEHEIHLFITADKLILHYASPCEAFPNTLAEEKRKLTDARCFPVFSIEDHEAPTKLLCRDDNQPLPDGTRAVRLGSARFRVCDSWLNLFAKANLRVKVFVVYKNDADGNVIKQEVEKAHGECNGAGVNFMWEPNLGKTEVLHQSYNLGVVLIGGRRK
jgi:hypothetical protein